VAVLKAAFQTGEGEDDAVVTTAADCTWHVLATATGKAGIPTVRMGVHHEFKIFMFICDFWHMMRFSVMLCILNLA